MKSTNLIKSDYSYEYGFLSVLLIACVLFISVNSAAANVGYDQEASFKNMSPGMSVLAEKWGVQLVAVRTSAAGHMIDFRYRVLDGKKSMALFEKDNRPYMLHQESGKSITVQNTAKVGPLRNQKTPKEGRVYWMFFRNHRGLIGKGDKVSVKVGDFLVKNIVVE